MNRSHDCVAHRLATVVVLAILVLLASPVRAQYTYQLDGWSPSAGTQGLYGGGFNPQDILIMNGFTVVPGAQTLTSLKFLVGYNFGAFATTADQTVTVAIFTGMDQTNPQAGSGLQRVIASTNTVTTRIHGFLYGRFGPPNGPEFATIPFAHPVTLPVGQVFYAGLLFYNVGIEEFPWEYDTNVSGPSPPYQGRSFEGYGNPTYSIDDFTDLMPSGVGNIVLRVNAVPEPGIYALAACLGASGFGLLIRRRHRL